MKSFSTIILALICLLNSVSGLAQTNLIVNGSFEGRNGIPQNQADIGPSSSAYPDDDLQNWDSPLNSTVNNPQAYSYPATLLSTDATGRSNPSYYGVTPHTGISVLQLLQHDNAGDHNYDQFATQQLAQPLLAGHSYQIQFWAIRPTPSAQYHTKLACYITNANPIYSASQNSLIPSPASKYITSSDIQPSQGWTLVSGIITIPSNENDNQWLTLGYDRSNQVYDSDLENPFPSSPAIDYIIDDVSIIDTGCPVVQQPGLITGSSSVCYERSTPNYTTYTISTSAPANTYYHSELVNNSSGQIVDSYDSGIQQPYKFFITGGNYAVGSYTLRVNITQIGPCASISNWRNKTVNIAHCTTGCSGKNCPASTSIQAYPSPASNTMTVEHGGQDATAIFYDIKGRVVKTINLHSSNAQTVINTSDLSSGIYSLRITTSENVVVTKTVSIQR